MISKEEDMQRVELKAFNVRLPREICDQIPKVRIRTGKKIQDFVREALTEHLRRLNL
jgi:predicted DNA-binding protein